MQLLEKEILGEVYIFDPTVDQILKRGILDPYTLSSEPNEWVVLREFVFWSARFQDHIIIPRWMCTDLASIPKIFRNILSVNDRHRLASLPHDFGYGLGEDSHHSRAEWDGILLDFCKQQKVPAWKRWLMWSGVRAGGWAAWNPAKKKLFIPMSHRRWYMNKFSYLQLSETDGYYRVA